MTNVGGSAFYGCKKLKSVTFKSKSLKIGAKAFYGCKKLTKVTLKAKTLKLGKQVFKGIAAKPVFTCPKGKASAYKKLVVKAGAPKKTKCK